MSDDIRDIGVVLLALEKRIEALEAKVFSLPDDVVVVVNNAIEDLENDIRRLKREVF